MIRAKVSSWSCFCWLNRASSSFTAKNIIGLILISAIWWCPCVESSLVLLEEGVTMIGTFSWQNSVSLCPVLFCTPRPNLPVTSDISWLPTFAFQSPMMRRTSFLGVSSRTSCRSSWKWKWSCSVVSDSLRPHGPYQAPPSVGFSRQEYCRGLPFPSPGDLPNPGIEPGSPTLQADALPSDPQGSS